MSSWKLEVANISADDLLRNWRWICPQQVKVAAASAFGDLVVVDSDGRVYLLDINSGTLKEVAATLHTFDSDERLQRTTLFADIAESLFASGWTLPEGKCFGYKTPIVFAESSGTPENIYVADLREYVPFMGDLHQQLKAVPDGAKVRLSTRNS